jgi:hypothetical protein
MPEKKKRKPKSRAKPAADLTDDEVMRRLFPKKATEEARKEASKQDKRSIGNKHS